jgi:hypothetical protein
MYECAKREPSASEELRESRRFSSIASPLFLQVVRLEEDISQKLDGD